MIWCLIKTFFAIQVFQSKDCHSEIMRCLFFTLIWRKSFKLDHMVTVQHVAIDNHEKSLRHGSACGNPSNWGQGTREAARSRRSEVRIMTQTNVSLGMSIRINDRREVSNYIHIFHVGSILQITLRSELMCSRSACTLIRIKDR